MKRILRALACALVTISTLGAVLPAGAQEAKRTFTLSYDNGAGGAGVVGTYDTQAQAVAAIGTLTGPPQMEWFYYYVNQVKEREVLPNGELRLTYWAGKGLPSDMEMVYESAFGGDHTSLAAAMEQASRVNEVTRPPECGPHPLQATSAWYLPPTYPLPNTDEIYEWLDSTVVGWQGSCHDHTGQVIRFGRRQFTECFTYVPGTWWRNAHQACVNETVLAFITTEVQECDDGVAAGCDVKSGDKVVVEQDIDVGWAKIQRTYHSGGSTTTQGFGPNWSHSQGGVLTVGATKAVLAESTGYTSVFEREGSNYRAINGTGERIEPASTGWRLLRRDNTTLFDSNGRLTSISYEDGRQLSYTYDNLGQLQTMTGPSGRTLTFRYTPTLAGTRIEKIELDSVSLATYQYDSSGRLTGVVQPGTPVRKYLYEDARFTAHLTGIKAPDGSREATFAYDSKGRVQQSQEPGEQTIATTNYSPQGTVQTDILGRETTYSLTSAGGAGLKVSTITDPNGTLSYEYFQQSVDPRRRLKQVVDRKNAITSYEYNSQIDPINGTLVRVHKKKEAVGTIEERVWETRVDDLTNRIVSMKGGDREVRYVRNARQQPVDIVTMDIANGASRTTTFAYCEASDVAAPGSTCPTLGAIKSINGPRTGSSDVTTFSYYAADASGCPSNPATCTRRKGDLWKTVNALGHATELLAYDAAGRPLSIKAPTGLLTDLEYHARGWLKTIKVRGANSAVESDDQITRIAYLTNGLVDRITEPDGAWTDFDYNAAKQLTDVKDDLGNKLTFFLDAAGNRTGEETRDSQNHLRRKLGRIYNTLGQLETELDAQLVPVEYLYDANGNTESRSDLLSAEERDHDPLNRLKQIMRDVGGIEASTSLKYDQYDYLKEVVDPKGLSTKYRRDGLGDLRVLESPDTGTTNYDYDTAGNLASVLDARGITTSHVSDALGRVIDTTYSDGTPGVKFTFDIADPSCPLVTGLQVSVGRLAKMSDESGSTIYCYDRFGNVSRKAQTTNGITFVTTYEYSLANKLVRMTYPDGAVVDYVRTAGRVAEIGVKRVGATREILLGNTSRAPFGPVKGWMYGNGRAMERTLDLNYRPDVVQDGSVGGISIGYDYDAAGNLEFLRTGSQVDPPLRKYTHDGLGRLTHVRVGVAPAVLQGYTYDDTGNRLSATTSGVQTSYGYGSSSHRLSSVGGVSRTYDAVGNLLNAGGTQLGITYAGHNRMRTATIDAQPSTTYRYNALGVQVHRQRGSVHRYAVHQEDGRWIGDYDSAGVPLQQFVWLDNLPVGVLAGAGAQQKLHYVQPDALGTPRVVIDPQRNLAIWKWPLEAEPFGVGAPLQDPDADGTQFVFDMRFPGQRFDAGSGLTYNYFRDYEPRTGRYTQSDPIGLAGGVSTYSYVGARPLTSIDQLGLITCVAVASGSTGIRNHSALYMSRGGENGAPFLFDPSGDYARAHEGGTGDFVEGDAASLSKFRKHQRDTYDDKTETTCKKTSVEEEERLVKKILSMENGPFPGSCAISVSNILSGSKYFPNVKGGTLLPGKLFRNAKGGR